LIKIIDGFLKAAHYTVLRARRLLLWYHHTSILAIARLRPRPVGTAAVPNPSHA
jgi:hypothetical protein